MRPEHTPADQLPLFVRPIRAVTVDDLVRTGSCRNGVKKWLRDHGQNPTAVGPGDPILSLLKRGNGPPYHEPGSRELFEVAANLRGSGGDRAGFGSMFSRVGGEGHGRTVGQRNGCGHGCGESYGEVLNHGSGVSAMLYGTGFGEGYGSAVYDSE